MRLAEKYTQIVTALAFLAVAPAWAADPVGLIADMEGVYKHRFKNGSVPSSTGDVETWMSEDVVEIVRFDDSSVYVRADLNFFNGHVCGIRGIARFDPVKSAFVYRAPSRAVDGESECQLSVGLQGKELVLSDRPYAGGPATCSAYCGMRGSLDYRIARAKKRTIRYLERLKASAEYQAAVAEAGK